MASKDKLLTYLNNHDFIMLREAIGLGIDKMALSRMVAEGILFNPKRRIYTTNLDWLTDPVRKYTAVCSLYPDAVICLISALTYYNLTDELEKKTWLAFPRSHRIVTQEYRTIYPSGIAYSLGINIYTIDTREIRIYDMEKTIIDAFKYHTIEVAYKALRGYLKRKDRNLKKLLDYGKQLHKPLDNIVTILMTDE